MERRPLPASGFRKIESGEPLMHVRLSLTVDRPGDGAILVRALLGRYVDRPGEMLLLILSWVGARSALGCWSIGSYDGKVPPNARLRPSGPEEARRRTSLPAHAWLVWLGIGGVTYDPFDDDLLTWLIGVAVVFGTPCGAILSLIVVTLMKLDSQLRASWR
jgi:hypothetical protein